MNEQYYIKKNGRYVAINDPHAYDGLGRGTWLVVVHEGGTSARNFIKPKFVELDAALYYLQDGLCKAMHKASEMRPKSMVMSKKELKAWKAYEKIMGKDKPAYFEYASLSEITEKGCEYLRKVIYDNKCDIDKIKEKYEARKFNNSILDLEVG